MKIIISIFFVLILAIFTTKLKINIQSLYKESQALKIYFNVNVGVFLLGFIKIFQITFTESNMQFLFLKIPYSKIKFDKESLKIMKQISIFDTLKILNQKIEKLDILLNIGTKDVKITAFLVATIATVLSVVSGLNRKRINFKKYYYNITPIYNENILNFNISAIITFKVKNIIKAIIYTKKNMKKENKIYEKTLVKI